MGCARGSRASPRGNSADRSGGRSEGNLAATAGGATFVTAPVALLGLLAAVAYFGIGRGIGCTTDFELAAAGVQPAGFSAADCYPESGEAFFSLRTISKYATAASEPSS